MKICNNCNNKWPDDFNLCPICGSQLETKEDHNNVGISLGNSNAVSGGVHSTDDHSQHDSNNQTNSNNASNSYNTTHNTTINEAQKSESELLNENKLAYRLKCKELFEDGLISSNGESLLRELQVRLNLADDFALPIKEEIRLQSKKRKKQLSQVGRQEVNQTKAIIEQNTTQALHRQLAKLEAWMQEYDDESLKSVYYQMSSMLQPVDYTNRYEDAAKDEYWEVYWAYIAYMLQNRVKEAGAAIASLGRWHNKFPEQNDIILHLAGQLMQNESMDSAKQMRNTLPAHYSADLQLLLDSIDELLQKDYERESVIIRPVHAFYISTLFTEFLETQKTEGQRRLEEAKKQKAQDERDEINRRHQEELAQQAAAQAQAEAAAEAARLAQSQQEAENIASAQYLARQQREADEAAAAAAREKAEAEKAEAERIEAEQRAAEEEAKRIRREKIIAWFERNIWYFISLVVAIIIIGVILFIYVPKWKEAEEIQENQRKLELENYELLISTCKRNISESTTDNLVPLDSAAHQLKRLRYDCKRLEQDNAVILEIDDLFDRKAGDLKGKYDRMKNGALTPERSMQYNQNSAFIDQLMKLKE